METVCGNNFPCFQFQSSFDYFPFAQKEIITKSHQVQNGRIRYKAANLQPLLLSDIHSLIVPSDVALLQERASIKKKMQTE